MITDALGNEEVSMTNSGLRIKFEQAQQKLKQEILEWEAKNWGTICSDQEKAWQTLMPILSRIWELVNIVEEGYLKFVI